MPYPLVSVILPTYNSAATIARALISIKAQNIGSLEVILYDDASSDETVSIAKEFEKTLDLKIIRGKENKGASFARNAAILKSSGKYVAFLDSDDEWKENKLSNQFDCFHHHPQATFVSCYAKLYDYKGQFIKWVNDQKHPVEGERVWKSLLEYNYLATPCVMVKREALDRVGLFDVSLEVSEDQDLWIRLAYDGYLGFVYEDLVNVYNKPQSLSKVHFDKHFANTVKVIEKYIDLYKIELSEEEKNIIFQERYFEFAKDEYANGNYIAGLSYFLKIALRKKWPKVLYFILAFSGPAKIVKKFLGRG